MLENNRSIKEFECIGNKIRNKGINNILESLYKNKKL
jgi:hypothetical protein